MNCVKFIYSLALRSILRLLASSRPQDGRQQYSIRGHNVEYDFEEGLSLMNRSALLGEVRYMWICVIHAQNRDKQMALVEQAQNNYCNFCANEEYIQYVTSKICAEEHNAINKWSMCFLPLLLYNYIATIQGSHCFVSVY